MCDDELLCCLIGCESLFKGLDIDSYATIMVNSFVALGKYELWRTLFSMVYLHPDQVIIKVDNGNPIPIV